MHSKLHKFSFPRNIRNQIETTKNEKAPNFVFEHKRINRSCFVQPKKKNFGQTTEHSLTDEFTDAPSNDWLATIFAKRGSHNVIIQTLNQEQQTKNSYPEKNALEMVDKFSETADGLLWQIIDNINKPEKNLLCNKEFKPFNLKSENVRISDVPRLKMIALKFTKHKCRNIELRQLEEKIVCVEYDVHQINSQDDLDKRTQIMRMRAFFSIKIPNLDKKILEKISDLSKDKDYVENEEIEIIDENVLENKCYLEDLRCVLKRKQMTRTHKKGKSDLKILYEFATNSINDPSNTSSQQQLSRSDLKGVASLILRCNSSIPGIIRKKVLPNDLSSTILGVLSKSVMAKLLREDG